jgi:cobalt-zinc-cadmium efflux system outer membrane protein
MQRGATIRSGTTAIGLVLLALSGPAPAGAATSPLADDTVVSGLVAESLAARPEVRRADAAVRAARERIPQAGALPDPQVSVGMQNAGFNSITIGEEGNSFVGVTGTQGIPLFGKRGLRTDIATLAAQQAEAVLERARLDTEADVRRGYVDLLLARDRLALLTRLEALWRQAEGIATARYESGQGVQSDLLRTQLELNRLRQRRWTLASQERTAVQGLNRLRAQPLTEPIVTTAKLASLPAPPPGAVDAQFADAAARSPELALAKLGVGRAERQVELARRERFPDIAITAGLMPRGTLDTMWQAGVSFTVPIFAARKQLPAIAEADAQNDAEAQSAASVEQILQLRVAERNTVLAAYLDTIRLYHDGLLIQSRATAESTLAQYQVGRVTFASVLEAIAAFIADEDGYLQTLADAHRLAIADDAVSLDPVGTGTSPLSPAAVAGAGAVSGAGDRQMPALGALAPAPVPSGSVIPSRGGL